MTALYKRAGLTGIRPSGADQIRCGFRSDSGGFSADSGRITGGVNPGRFLANPLRGFGGV